MWKLRVNPLPPPASTALEVCQHVWPTPPLHPSALPTSAARLPSHRCLPEAEKLTPAQAVPQGPSGSERRADAVFKGASPAALPRARLEEAGRHLLTCSEAVRDSLSMEAETPPKGPFSTQTSVHFIVTSQNITLQLFPET